MFLSFLLRTLPFQRASIVLLGLFVTFSKEGLAQFSFDNSSFEGIAQETVPPPGWNNCGGSSTPDTQPGGYGVTTPASKGNTYLGLVCRSNGTFESVYQPLSTPLQPGSCYAFTLDLARSSEYFGFNTPALCRIWGGTDQCKVRELLWASPTITHTNWQTYPVKLTPVQTATYIIIEAYFNTTSFYNGNVLIDNLSLIQTKMGKPIVFDLGKDTLLCFGQQLQLDVSVPQASLRWSDGSTHSALTITQPGTYWLEAQNDCASFRDEIKVNYQECPQNFFIPNVITPNGDGKNDQFVIGELYSEGWTLEIYNRWGKQVYVNHNYHQEWDADGLPSGVYYYQLHKAGVSTSKGWVQVLR